MIVDVSIGGSGNLTGFNMRKLDPLASQLPLYSFPCVITCKDHFTSRHDNPSNVMKARPLWARLLRRLHLKVVNNYSSILVALLCSCLNHPCALNYLCASKDEGT